MKIIPLLFFVAFCEFDKYSKEDQQKHDHLKVGNPRTQTRWYQKNGKSRTVLDQTVFNRTDCLLRAHTLSSVADWPIFWIRNFVYLSWPICNGRESLGAKETIREKSALGLFAPLANKHTVLEAVLP